MAKIAPFEDLSGIAEDRVALGRKIDEDGFGLFRGLIPREEVLQLRRLILRMYQARGWLLPGTDPEEGIVDPSINEIESYASNGADQRAYQDVYRMKQFHQLAHHPAIVGLCEEIFGEPVFVHPRNIARLMAPHRETAPTPPHQDFIYVQGTRATYTCWIPLGDCPRELGGLSLMRGTHKLDILPVRGAEGAGGRTVVLDELGQRLGRRGSGGWRRHPLPQPYRAPVAAQPDRGPGPAVVRLSLPAAVAAGGGDVAQAPHRPDDLGRSL